MCVSVCVCQKLKKHDKNVWKKFVNIHLSPSLSCQPQHCHFSTYCSDQCYACFSDRLCVCVRLSLSHLSIIVYAHVQEKNESQKKGKNKLSTAINHLFRNYCTFGSCACTFSTICVCVFVHVYTCAYYKSVCAVDNCAQKLIFFRFFPFALFMSNLRVASAVATHAHNPSLCFTNRIWYFQLGCVHY